jgi:site-specific recombinase XerC
MDTRASFHDTSHTFATRLVRAGVDLITVKELLCHARITTIARYAHSHADVAALLPSIPTTAQGTRRGGKFTGKTWCKA